MTTTDPSVSTTDQSMTTLNVLAVSISVIAAVLLIAIAIIAGLVIGIIIKWHSNKSIIKVAASEKLIGGGGEGAEKEKILMSPT